MKHYIIGKFRSDIPDKAKTVAEIRKLFTTATEIPGVKSAEIVENCVQRDNRYDVMIILTMEPSALDAWDHSGLHHRWKEEYGGLLEKKAIFDQP